jgi:hypothetical protein
MSCELKESTGSPEPARHQHKGQRGKLQQREHEAARSLPAALTGSWQEERVAAGAEERPPVGNRRRGGGANGAGERGGPAPLHSTKGV